MTRPNNEQLEELCDRTYYHFINNLDGLQRTSLHTTLFEDQITLEPTSTNWRTSTTLIDELIRPTNNMAQHASTSLRHNSDSLILRALETSTNLNVVNTPNYGLDEVIEAYGGLLDSNPMDLLDTTFAIIGWAQWERMRTIPGFTEPMTWYDERQLVFPGQQCTIWRGTVWIPVGNLPKENEYRTCYHYKRAATRHDIGDHITIGDIRSDTEYMSIVELMLDQKVTVCNPDHITIVKHLEAER